MRKSTLLILYLVILYISIPKKSISQSKTNISFGLRTNFGGMKGINNVINQYNNTRTWLDNSLGNQYYQNGFEIGIENITENAGISMLKYFRVWNTTSAKGITPAGEEFKRKLKTRVSGIEIIDFWVTPIKVFGVNIGGGVMPMGGGMYRVRTKINEEDWVKLALSDLENIGETGFLSTFHPFTNFHIDITKIIDKYAFHVQFLYSRNWFQEEYNLVFVNKELNPSTYNSANYRLKHGQNNYGLKLIVVI